MGFPFKNRVYEGFEQWNWFLFITVPDFLLIMSDFDNFQYFIADDYCSRIGISKVK